MHELTIQTSWLLAFVLGALHILEPAHGRSIVNALIVGARGSLRDVLSFGFSVIVSHLLVAGLLAAIAWVAGEHLGADVVAPAFKIAGAALTVLIGVLMMTCGVGQHTTCVHKHHGVEHLHDPDHEEKHAANMLQAHLLSPAVLGVTGGLIPCQGTIALIALAVGEGNLSAAVGLLISFALGLGSCLIVVGAITVSAKSRASALSSALGSSRLLALAPGVLVTLMGAVALWYSGAELLGGHHH